MLKVKTPDEVIDIIDAQFSPTGRVQTVPACLALGRVLAQDVVACEYVPDFNRSTVDGYAVAAADTFGCSDSLPAVLTLGEQIIMGCPAVGKLAPQQCRAIPTGGELPAGADSVVMLEYTEVYGDGTIGILKSVAPGNNIIFRGDDVCPGKIVIRKGRRLAPQDIGALAAMGITEVTVNAMPTVGIISTGDELVDAGAAPLGAQIRDVNSPMLACLVESLGAKAVRFGIAKDNAEEIDAAVVKALAECDAVLISGGSSVGEKDATSEIIGSKSELLFHGIAIKPGKPTILGNANGKPLFGLPGHPAAAYIISRIFVRRALARLGGNSADELQPKAICDEKVSANHGRAECIGVRLYKKGEKLFAHPIRGKSGLISSLADCDGFICISAQAEGIEEGAEVTVTVG